ncbi:MAG: hypothetical protein GX417_03150 [Clostridiales bacterium]|nr:hypothetical protein [Clostridiales bacterium]
MKRIFSRGVLRVFAALFAAAFLMGLGVAATASPVFVSDASELTAALSDAAASGDATTIYYLAGTSLIELSGSTVTIPTNVTLDLSTSTGTLRLSSGTLNVYGVISGGAVDITGGALIRESGSSITATITAGGSGTVRAPRTLSLENLDPSSGESILSVTYAGEAAADTSDYVARLATGVIYPRMTGTNYSSYKEIETVVTDAGHVFRLGTKYTDTLSLAYTLTYGGLTGATLDTLNPSSYTASDAAFALNNPTKDGFTFAGWTCDALGVTVPASEMVIPEGTTGNLTLIANWVEGTPGGGGRSGGSSSSGTTGSTTDTTEDAAAQQEAAAASDTATTQQSTRRTRVASSSTKVSFSSNEDTVLPTIESVRKQSFPWGWAVGGFAGLGVVIYVAVKSAERRKLR